MKEQVRVLGFDDSPFTFEDEKALIVGVLMRLPNYIEAVLSTHVEVDGGDSTQKLAECILDSHYAEQPKAIILDGVALGGFNVVDLEALWKETDIPVLTVTRDPPDLKAMHSALQKHFDDWKERYALIEKNELFVVETEHHPLHVSAWGMKNKDASYLIRSNTVRGALPECVRTAHLIARGIADGESRGHA